MKFKLNRDRIDRDLLLYFIDAVIVACCYTVIWLLGTVQGHIEWELLPYAINIAGTAFIFALCLLVCRINATIWRYAGGREYIKLFVIAIVAGIISAIIFEIYKEKMPATIFLAFAGVLAATMITLSRIVYKELTVRMFRDKVIKEGRRLLIVGAGEAGYRMLDEIKGNPASGLVPVGLVDDDIQKQNRTIDNIKVLGKISDIEKICDEHSVQVIYIAIPSASNEDRKRIVDECAKTTCPVKILPYLYELNEEGGNIVSRVRDITPEELLGREPIKVANEKILSFVKGKKVLITGGGGSIGSELCRQIASHQPEKLILVDVYENTTYEIQQELHGRYGDRLNMAVYILTVCDYERINHLFATEKPDIVLHAAAHKHVPLMETVPEEAVKNNIFGTYNVARAANNNGVQKFVLISTDKAVNPTNIMGATKRVCEMIVQYFNRISRGTTFAAVRFGNVLGSHGSVIPLFKEQIEKRRDVTVTHPEIIRYFMTIPEASQLVLTASVMADGGELFVLDMGEPVKIDNLARKMISLAGLTVGKDINVKYVGLRPGEKLFEELLMSEEGLKKTANGRIFIGGAINMDYDRFPGNLEMLKNLANRPNVTLEEVETALMKLVPTFKRYKSAKITIEEKNK